MSVSIAGPNVRTVQVFKKTALASAISIALGEMVAAEESEQPTLETMLAEMVVTAQRRPEPLGDVPLAVSAYSGDFISEVNLSNPQDLTAFTPGLAGDSADSFIDVLQVRGIYTFDFGVGGDPSISFFKNGFYQGRNGPVITSFYDVDRVEVARGPQGFLFGRNSIAGAVNTITRRPDPEGASGMVEADWGHTGRRTVEGVVNAPLGEEITARLAAYVVDDDGYVADGFDSSRPDLVSEETQAVRLSLRRQSEATDVNLMIEHENREQSGTIYRAIRADTWATLVDTFSVPLPGGMYDSSGDLGDGEADDVNVLSTSLEIEHDFGGAVLTSLTGFRDHDYFYAEDYDGSPLRINHYHQDQAGDYAEQELRLVSDADDGMLSWYAGASWYRENVDVLFTNFSDEDALCAYYNAYGYATCQDYYAYLGYEFSATREGLAEPNQVRGRYSGWAAYVDLNLALSERLDVGFGLRHTSDTKEFANWARDIDSDLGPYLTLGFTSDGFLSTEKTWRDVAPRALVRFRPNENLTWFASVTSGYKSGGFGSFTLSPSPPWPTEGVTERDALPAPFDPEQSVSYEAGFKATLADGRAQTRVNVYRYRFEDLQVVVPGPAGSFIADNVGAVDGQGVEWELQAILAPHLEVRVSAAYADTEGEGMAPLCGDIACDGNGLGRMPKFSYSAVAQGTYPVAEGEWLGRVEAYGQSEVFGGPSLDSRFRLDGWMRTTLRGGYRSRSGWEVTAYVENAFDERYFDAVNEDDGIIPGTTFGPNRPRTLGLRMRWAFGD